MFYEMNSLSISVIACNSCVCISCTHCRYELQIPNTLNVSQWMMRLDTSSGLHYSMINYLRELNYLIHYSVRLLVDMLVLLVH